MNGFRTPKRKIKKKSVMRRYEEFDKAATAATKAWDEFEPASKRLSEGDASVLSIAAAAFAQWEKAIRAASAIARKCGLAQAQEMLDNLETVRENYAIVREFAEYQ